MNIIEKLGITPIRESCRGAHSFVVHGLFLYAEVRDLERRRNQMLEALIEITIEDDENFTPGTPLRVGIDKRIALIESVTRNSWEEIKALKEGEG